MPDIASNAGEEDRRVAAFESAHHRHFRDGMPLPIIFAQEERIDPGGVAAHDYVLVVVGEDLRLDEVAGTEELRDGAGLAHGAKSPFAKSLGARGVFALQLFP